MSKEYVTMLTCLFGCCNLAAKIVCGCLCIFHCQSGNEVVMSLLYNPKDKPCAHQKNGGDVSILIEYQF